VRPAHRRGLGDGRVADQGAFDLDRAQPVAGDVQHVVDTAHDPVVAVLVAARAVAGEVEAGVFRPVLADITFGVAVQGPHHGGPRLLQHQVALFARRNRVARIIQDVRFDAGEGPRRAARLQVRHGQRRNHEHARFSLPPGIHDGTAFLADDPVIPAPGLRIDGLAYAAQQAQGGEIVAVGPRVPKPHQPADGRRRHIEHVDPVLLDHAPPAVRIGEGRRALVHEARRAEQQRPIDDVRMPRHPARIRRAPVAVVLFEVEHPLECRADADHVAAMRVDDGLRFARRAGGVEHVERVLGIHDLGVAAVAACGRARDGQRHQVMIPVVAARLHRHVVARPLEHDDVLDRAGALDGLVEDTLQLDNLAIHVATVAGDGDIGLAVLDAPVERLDRETAVDDGMHRAYFRAGEHRDRQLRHPAHVDGHAVAFLDPHAAQDVGELAHLAVERMIGERAHLAILAFPDERQLVAAPGRHVTVQAVVHDIGLAADKPLVKRLLAVIQHFIPFLVPLEFLSLGCPEALEVLLGPAGHFLVALDRSVGDDVGRGLIQFGRFLAVRVAHDILRVGFGFYYTQGLHKNATNAAKVGMSRPKEHKHPERRAARTGDRTQSKGRPRAKASFDWPDIVGAARLCLAVSRSPAQDARI